jgi:hypothetical protein
VHGAGCDATSARRGLTLISPTVQITGTRTRYASASQRVALTTREPAVNSDAPTDATIESTGASL